MREDKSIIDVVKRRNGDDEVPTINERGYERSPCSRVIKQLHMQRAFSIPSDPFISLSINSPDSGIYTCTVHIFICVFMENSLNVRRHEINQY